MENITEELDIEPFLDSVSSGDVVLSSSSVSGGDAYYEINVYMLPEPTLEPIPEPAEIEEVVYTIWDKPLEDYTVTEGFLCLLVLIALVVLVWCAVKGGFKWRN